jgi:integrase
MGTAKLTKTKLTELIQANRHRRFRRQHGTVVERRGKFFLRYYTEGQDGNRVKVTEELCKKDATHHSVDCQLVDMLREQRMVAVNGDAHAKMSAPTPLPKAPPVTIGAFWKLTYLPWAKENLRHSTSRGYERLWSQYLQGSLESKTLVGYETGDGSEFLTALAKNGGLDKKGLGRRTLQHVRSLASGIFTHAVNVRIITLNPWHEVKILARVREPKPRIKYTAQETVAILNALERPDVKLFFALCAVLALRPSETAALRWEDIEPELIHIRGAAPYGVPGETKTERSKRDLLLIEPVKTLVETWRKACGSPSNGWLFTRSTGQPVDSNDFSRRYIAPVARKVCPRWAGLYSGRHGAATRLYNKQGDSRAAFQVLGNSKAVVDANYIEPDQEQGIAGLRLAEQVIGDELKKARS